MQERIFKPLGMTSTTYFWRRDADSRIVAGHNPDPLYNRDLATRIFDLIQESGEPLSFWTHEHIKGVLRRTGMEAPEPNEMVPNVAFSLLTTVSDYAQFLTAYLEPGNAVLGLPQAARAAMQSPVSRVNSALSWGLGIGIERAEGHEYLWQWGDNGGWKDFMLAETTSRSAIVVLTNGRNGMHVNERVLRASTGIAIRLSSGSEFLRRYVRFVLNQEVPALTSGGSQMS